MTGFDVLFYRQTWSQLVKSKLQSKLECYVVTVIPRCNHGQIYYSQCLQHSPHFSLSQEGTSVLLKALEKKGNIRIVNYRKDPTKKKSNLHLNQNHGFHHYKSSNVMQMSYQLSIIFFVTLETMVYGSIFTR